jgi:hypothetical protein
MPAIRLSQRKFCNRSRFYTETDSGTFADGGEEKDGAADGGTPNPRPTQRDLTCSHAPFANCAKGRVTPNTERRSRAYSAKARHLPPGKPKSRRVPALQRRATRQELTQRRDCGRAPQCGAWTSGGQSIFHASMMELGLLGFLVLILVFSITLLRRYPAPPDEIEHL